MNFLLVGRNVKCGVAERNETRQSVHFAVTYRAWLFKSILRPFNRLELKAIKKLFFCCWFKNGMLASYKEIAMVRTFLPKSLRILVVFSTDSERQSWKPATTFLPSLNLIPDMHGLVAFTHLSVLSSPNITCLMTLKALLNLIWMIFTLQSSFSNGGHLFAAVHGNVIQLYSSTTFENVGNLKGHNGKVLN